MPSLPSLERPLRRLSGHALPADEQHLRPAGQKFERFKVRNSNGLRRLVRPVRGGPLEELGREVRFGDQRLRVLLGERERRLVGLRPVQAHLFLQRQPEVVRAAAGLRQLALFEVRRLQKRVPGVQVRLLSGRQLPAAHRAGPLLSGLIERECQRMSRVPKQVRPLLELEGLLAGDFAQFKLPQVAVGH